MKTLAKKYPTATEFLTVSNAPGLAQMLGMFYRCSDLDLALGTNSACNNWVNERAVPSRRMEEKAQSYLKGVSGPAGTPQVAEAALPPEDDATIYMVVYTGTRKRQLEKVLDRMFHCEVMELD